METSFEELREKEVININSGKKLGHIIDVVFDLTSSKIMGIILPGEKKIFKKGDDIFVAVDEIQRIGDDVILVGINQDKNVKMVDNRRILYQNQNVIAKRQNIKSKYQKELNFVRFRRINNNKYN